MQASELKKALSAYKQQKKNCGRRKDRTGQTIEMHLTFDQWLEIWLSSGKWELRGRGTGKYVMSRVDDLGHYELGNVKIALNADNIRESAPRVRAKLIGKANPKVSAAKKGKPQPWVREANSKPCTVDGVRIFPSRIALVRVLGRPATRREEFRYV